MTVVSDTSPLTALLRVGESVILSNLFTVIIIPAAVSMELRRAHSDLPDWLRIECVKDVHQVKILAETVDSGEAGAIVLAKELRADRLLIDERKGRRLAHQEQVPVIGLLGVVILAKRRNLIPSGRALLDRLHREAGMYLADDVREAALQTISE